MLKDLARCHGLVVGAHDLAFGAVQVVGAEELDLLDFLDYHLARWFHSGSESFAKWTPLITILPNTRLADQIGLTLVALECHRAGEVLEGGVEVDQRVAQTA